jgi:carboxyl-terminal processing protease
MDGYMEEANRHWDELKEKTIIVLPKKKAAYKKHMQLKGDFQTGKVFVLQNENSASAVKF